MFGVAMSLFCVCEQLVRDVAVVSPVFLFGHGKLVSLLRLSVMPARVHTHTLRNLTGAGKHPLTVPYTRTRPGKATQRSEKILNNRLKCSLALLAVLYLKEEPASVCV